MTPISAAIRDGDAGASKRAPRRRFGLDSPLPADPRIVERAVLRHIATCRPTLVVLTLARVSEAGTSRPGLHLGAGVPDLMLLIPGGRVAFLTIKTQARDLTRAERAFADLCRACAIPVHVVRSLAEARAALDRLAIPTVAETPA